MSNSFLYVLPNNIANMPIVIVKCNKVGYLSPFKIYLYNSQLIA